MIKFFIKRIAMIIPTFIGVTLLTFALIHLIPGDPVILIAGERGITPERHAILRAELGLDKPILVQYGRYVWGVLHGDLGKSIVTKQPVFKEFITLFPATLELSFFALILAVVFGVPAGVIAGVKRGSVFDHSVMGLSLTGYSMPIFWWALLMILFFSVFLQ